MTADASLPADCADNLDDPRLRRLLGYWRQRCTGAAMANAASIDPLEFPYILGYVTLVDVEGPPRRYRFRLDGSRLAELSGIDYTGKYLEELGPADYVAFIAATYDQVVDSGRPYAYRKEGAFGDQIFDEETLVLPLGDSGTVRRLMVAVIPGDALIEGKSVT